MTIQKGIYKVKDDQGNYNVIHLQTHSDQVLESSSKRFVTDSEKNTWNNKANASHTHTSSNISDATNASTVNTIAKRDSAGDISCRLVRSEYANQSTISGAMAFRVSNSSDNYIRFCSDTTAIRNFINTYAKSDVYTKSEADGRYRQKSDVVFTDTISITTPAT